MKHHFTTTGEAVFDRIFNRPIGLGLKLRCLFEGLRCFQEFVYGDYGKTNPVAVLLLQFNNEVKDLGSEVPSVALVKATTLRAKFLDAPASFFVPTLVMEKIVSAAKVWAEDTAIYEQFVSRLDRLAGVADAEGAKRNVNLKVAMCCLCG